MEPKDKLDQLLDRYFEGLTSCEEEQEMRRLFHQGEVPEHLEVYRSLFAWIDEESRSVQEVRSGTVQSQTTRRRRFRFSPAVGIAAGLILLLGMAGVWQILSPVAPENYVWIDGKRYTDQTLVHQHARAAFEAVSFSQEDILFSLFEE
ncbi:MAG: hypothetical protein LIP08_09245 [Bacteroides sp.]|nr:hypothetical protein [Bacteroides sp.]